MRPSVERVGEQLSWRRRELAEQKRRRITRAGEQACGSSPCPSCGDEWWPCCSGPALVGRYVEFVLGGES